MLNIFEISRVEFLYQTDIEYNRSTSNVPNLRNSKHSLQTTRGTYVFCKLLGKKIIDSNIEITIEQHR